MGIGRELHAGGFGRSVLGVRGPLCFSLWCGALLCCVEVGGEIGVGVGDV
jgi:hypothetical protein